MLIRNPLTPTLRLGLVTDNYDYMFSYVFYLEGTLEILMGASGYLQVG